MKNVLKYLLVFAMTVVLLCGCSGASDSGDAEAGGAGAGTEAASETESGAGAESEQQEYIGIISAMDNEVDLLLKEAEIDHVDTFATMDYHVGTLHDKPVVIVKGGIGKVRAAAGVTTLLNQYKISDVIFTGIAGGVGDETKVLDEVVATGLVQHDYGEITNDGFVRTEGTEGEEKGVYYCDEGLVDLAYESAKSVLKDHDVYKGIIATGDQFVASEEYVEGLEKDYDAMACDMEGASIAIVCSQYDVPFVVIRAMSDKADGKAHESYENMGDIAADNSSKIVMKMLEQLDR